MVTNIIRSGWSKIFAGGVFLGVPTLIYGMYQFKSPNNRKLLENNFSKGEVGNFITGLVKLE